MESRVKSGRLLIAAVRSWRYPLAALAVLLSFVAALAAIYSHVKAQTIRDLNLRQLVHARQAAQGIGDYMEYTTGMLSYLARLPEIAALDDAGRRAMADYQATHADEVKGITRVDAQGRILYTVPDTASSGRDISAQEHIRLILKTRRPVISDVFMAVQGFRTIAVHVPVFRSGVFAGTLAFLLSFDVIARRYIENIHVGASGYAWVISAKGFEISCPVPGHVGHSVFANSRSYPAILAMAGEMLRGRTGVTSYRFARGPGPGSPQVLKHAVYMPIPIGNTFWSIVVATPEDEILDSLAGFRSQLTLLAVALLAAGIVGTRLVVRSRALLRGQRERETILGALRESERKYRALIETTNTGFVIIDEQGRVVDANAEYVRLTGHRALAEIAGRCVTEWTAPYEQEKNRVAVACCVADGQIRNLEIDYITADGTVTPIEINATVVELGGAPRILTLCRDISERRTAARAQQKLQADLSQAQRVESIGRLAGGVAHDFNNMLSVIRGRAELALNRADPADPLRATLEEILAAAARSEELTRQLLTFARKQPVAPRVLNLDDAVESTLKMLRRLIGEDIDLVWKPGHDTAPVKVDPAQLDQVLANLAVNARDAIAGVGRLTIETRNVALDAAACAGIADAAPGAYVRLTVSDDGCGMDAETRTHLFEPFFTTKAAGRGTGLGLATVHGIVRQNGGFIDVASEPGRGTTFHIYLPRQSGAVSEAPAGEPPSSPARGSETVLLVEDEPMVLELNQAMLEMLGYTVLPARSPAEALQLAASRGDEIELLITDVIMPEMNGRQLAGKLLASRPGLACLYVSGYTASVITRHGVLDEEVHFLQKPFSLHELALKVRAALDARPRP